MLIKAGMLTSEQIAFWSKIYYNGLGEYLYVNQLEVSSQELFTIVSDSDICYKQNSFQFSSGTIIPVGGGKDSVVSLELLKGGRKDNYALIMNPRGASLHTAALAGYDAKKINLEGKCNLIQIKRLLDPKLLELNDKGYLNGHTPFSALLAFITALSAIIFERQYIALSNENSASEGNLVFNDLEVNHQYSKSFGAERELHTYIKQYICSELNYFSFLRPLYELQIAALFCHMDTYHQDFRSCNRGSKTDSWCGQCPKCLFVYIILSPFLDRKHLQVIFGKDLFSDKSMLFQFRQLAGLEENKPFECVGTYREVRAALALTLRHVKEQKQERPLLLQEFEHIFGADLDDLCKDAVTILKCFNKQHLLDPVHEKLIRASIATISEGA